MPVTVVIQVSAINCELSAKVVFPPSLLVKIGRFGIRK